jgi:hypothetical protein
MRLQLNSNGCIPINDGRTLVTQKKRNDWNGMNKGSTLVFEAIIKMKQFLGHRERLSLAPQL